MSQFVTRVLLHEPTVESDYEKLHEAMGSVGFSRQIFGAAAQKYYHLPPAEYFLEGNLTLLEVRAMAMNAAGQTGKKYAVLVSKVDGCIWEGLAEVT